MERRAAFRATYADWKLIKTRKCVQVIVEIPLEESDFAYQVLSGMPPSGKDVWLAVARLDPHQQTQVRGGSPVPASNENPSDGSDKHGTLPSESSTQTTPNEVPPPRTSTEGLPPPQQAGIWMNSRRFREWLKEYKKLKNMPTPTEADLFIKVVCNVESKSQIAATNVGFLLIKSDYEQFVKNNPWIENVSA